MPPIRILPTLRDTIEGEQPRDGIRNFAARCREAADATWTNPVAVAAAILTRASLTAPIGWRMPGVGIGSPQPPSLFAVLVGKSGDGKSMAMKAAEQMMPWRVEHGVSEAFPASGQGLIHRILGEKIGRDKDGNRVAVHSNKAVLTEYVNPAPKVFVQADEGGKLWSDIARQGSSLGEIVKSAWNSATLGNQTKNSGEWLHVPADTYSVGMLSAAVGEVINNMCEADGGFMQRILVVSAAPRADKLPPWKEPNFTQMAVPAGAFDDPEWDPEPTIDPAVAAWVRERAEAHVRELATYPDPWESLRHPFDAHQGQLALRVAATLSALTGEAGHIDRVSFLYGLSLLAESSQRIHTLHMVSVGEGQLRQPLVALRQKVFEYAANLETDATFTVSDLVNRWRKLAPLRAHVRATGTNEADVLTEVVEWLAVRDFVSEVGINRKGNRVYERTGKDMAEAE